MLKFSRFCLVAAPLLAAGLAAAPAQAVQGNEKVNMVIIYGDDKCPESQGDAITVCARKDEGERYRIPEPFRQQTGPGNEPWNSRVIAYERVGATGTQSCSPVGAGGWTGCSQQMISNAYAQKKASSDVQFSKMIEAEREKRLSTLDAEAKVMQQDSEAAQAAYEARRKAQAAADAKAAAAKPAGQ